MSDSGIGGAVLGSSAVLGAGVAVLPYTGENPVGKFLATAAIAAGILCLLVFVTTRVLKKLL